MVRIAGASKAPSHDAHKGPKARRGHQRGSIPRLDDCGSPVDPAFRTEAIRAEEHILDPDSIRRSQALAIRGWPARRPCVGMSNQLLGRITFQDRYRYQRTVAQGRCFASG
ncbi:hypothetical protein N7489_003287 [Penicillium chrysogenum]|uniref:uncharacterized protein n=1 Tax=Penicillium chrysogenum TaxID=5076 RepID=UPI0024DF1C5C|nr:uncharacterized protein N7489_003287 [Penicillium chrysogenum]KAJ5252877.1 hypothetical protein N7489_003287 [Penicillium chrysogenum]